MDPLKTAWKRGAGAHTKSAEDIKKMLRENKHPALKKIRRQMLWETLAFGWLGITFYDGFDGYKKPLYVNIILGVSVLLIILHNIIGYYNAKRSVDGYSLRASLERYEQSLRRFALWSILLRVLYSAGLMIFFLSVTGMGTWSWVLIGVLVSAFAFQMHIMKQMWQNRINEVNLTVRKLKMGE